MLFTLQDVLQQYELFGPRTDEIVGYVREATDTDAEKTFYSSVVAPCSVVEVIDVSVGACCLHQGNKDL